MPSPDPPLASATEREPQHPCERACARAKDTCHSLSRVSGASRARVVFVANEQLEKSHDRRTFFFDYSRVLVVRRARAEVCGRRVARRPRPARSGDADRLFSSADVIAPRSISPRSAARMCARAERDGAKRVGEKCFCGRVTRGTAWRGYAGHELTPCSKIYTKTTQFSKRLALRHTTPALCAENVFSKKVV